MAVVYQSLPAGTVDLGGWPESTTEAAAEERVRVRQYLVNQSLGRLVNCVRSAAQGWEGAGPPLARSVLRKRPSGFGVSGPIRLLRCFGTADPGTGYCLLRQQRRRCESATPGARGECLHWFPTQSSSRYWVPTIQYVGTGIRLVPASPFSTMRDATRRDTNMSLATRSGTLKTA